MVSTAVNKHAAAEKYVSKVKLMLLKRCFATFKKLVSKAQNIFNHVWFWKVDINKNVNCETVTTVVTFNKYFNELMQE